MWRWPGGKSAALALNLLGSIVEKRKRGSLPDKSIYCFKISVKVRAFAALPLLQCARESRVALALLLLNTSVHCHKPTRRDSKARDIGNRPT